MDEVSGRDFSAEVSHRPAGELAPNAPVNSHIQHYRSQNEMSLRNILWTGLPIGLAIGAVESGTLAFGLLAIPLLAVSVIYGVKIFRERPKLVQSNITEFKNGDYTAMQMWAPFLPALGWLVAIPVDALGLSSLPTPPLLAALFSGALLGVGGSFGMWAMFQRSFRVGKRRIKAISEKQSLEGVTQPRMDAVEANGDILGALMAVGAVDGNIISIKVLGKLLNCDMDNAEVAESLVTRVKDLQSDDIIKISGQALYQKQQSWEVTVTPDGIRNLTQIGHR